MTGRRWPVGEHVPEVTVAAPATDLDALHAVRAVAHEREMVGVERLVERRPAGARLELGRRPEERQSAQPTAVHALRLVVQEAAPERPAGTAGQPGPPPPARGGRR